MAENIGSVSVLIGGDYSPLVTAFGQAQTAAASAGQGVAAAFNSGSASIAGQAEARVQALRVSILGESAAAAEAVATNEALAEAQAQVGATAETAAAGIESQAAAAAHGVSQIQATSGALRVLEGSGGMRAAERFLTMIPGVGAALQLAFPLIGLVAVIEMIGRLAGKFGEASEAEKKFAADMKQLDDEMGRIADHIDHTNVEITKLTEGALRGLKLEQVYDSDKAARDQANIDGTVIKLKLLESELKQAQAVQKVGGSFATRHMLGFDVETIQHEIDIAKATIQNGQMQLQDDAKEAELRQAQIVHQQSEDAKKAAEEANRLASERAAEVRKEQETLKGAFEDQLSDLKQNHQVTLGEEIAFWTSRLSFVAQWGGKYADLTREIHKTLGSLDQEADKARAEAQKKALEAALKDLDESGRAQDEQIRKREEAEKQAQDLARQQSNQQLRVNQIGIQGTGAAAEQANAMAKLAAQRQYGEEVGHTKQQELAYAAQIAAIDQKTLDIKTSIAQMELIAAIQANAHTPTREAQLKIAEEELKVQQAIGAALNHQYSTQTSQAAQQRAARIGGGLPGIASSLPSTLGNAIAAGITQGHIGQQIQNALKGIGKEMMGDVFKDVIAAIIGNSLAVLSNTISTDLNTVWLAVKSVVGSILPFADGGSPPVGVPSIVGERGPELFVPKTAGAIVPNHMLKGYADGAGLSTTLIGTHSRASGDSHVNVGAIHLHGVRDVLEMARLLPDAIKAVSPKFSPATK